MYYAKDGITVAPMLDTSHPKQSGLFPVRVRVTYARQRRYYPTGKDLTESDWSAMTTSKVRALVAVRKDIENTYNSVRDVVEELAMSGGFSLDALNNRLKGAASDTLNTMFRAKIAELEQSGRVGSMLVYDNVLKGLTRFAGERIRFELIAVAWLGKYADFLRKEGKTQTTIAIHFRHLRAILNEARRLGVVKEAQYPFGRGKYEIQAGEGRKMALTLEQIGKIANHTDGTADTARYRDYWLFLYLCNGVNVADFVKLRYKDIVNGEICFVRQKTERTTKTRKEIRVVVSDRMQGIIDRWGVLPQPGGYIFPILDGGEDAMRQKMKTLYLTKAINKRISGIGEALGIGTISTYTARHNKISFLLKNR